MNALRRELKRLKQVLARTARQGDAPEYFAAWRAVLRLYQEVSRDRSDPEPSKEEEDEKEYQELWSLAGEAILNLGGQAEPTLTTLDQYACDRYGPMLGVSDEGSAAAAIRRGALASPKCIVLRQLTPMTIGVAHDAERLGGVGEVVVGPKEYSTIRLACMGRILTTTNVGTRVNLRNYSDPPVVKLKADRPEKAVASASKKLRELFEPFWKTLSGKPRHLTVLVHFDDRAAPEQREAVFNGLQAALATREFCNPRVHRLGLLAVLPEDARLEQAKAAVDLARRCSLKEVAVDGPPLPVAGEVISLPGLLSYFRPEELNDLLAYAANGRVRVVPKQRVDPQTTARHVWTGLMVARNMGLELGKYGLVPLTFEQQREVIVRINQQWIKNWCAAPVCYVDYPIVTAREVYHGKSLVRGIERWLGMVRKLGVRVVLIDTAKKSEGRHLLKKDPQDEHGILSLAEIRALDAFARKLEVKVLWAGGISVAQAFDFGKLGVFGIYVTSAAAALQPLGPRSRLDPALAAEREPQPEAVARVKLLLEAGFLVGQLQARGLQQRAQEIEAAARELIPLLDGLEQEKDPQKKHRKEKETKQLQVALHALAAEAWKIHFRTRSEK